MTIGIELAAGVEAVPDNARWILLAKALEDSTYPTEDHNGSFHHLNLRQTIECVPRFDDWRELDGSAKLDRMKLFLDQPLGPLLAARSDHRTHSETENALITPYGNPVTVWPEQLLEKFSGDELWTRMQNGELDEMVWEMGEAGEILPGQDANEGYLEVASSTGEAPSLYQYYEMLKVYREMGRVVRESPDWETASRRLEKIKNLQNKEIIRIYGLPTDAALIRTQSGTEAELLLQALWGIDESMFTDETGSATGLALAGMHPSHRTWMGKMGLKGQIEGYRASSPKEVALRNQGEIRDAEHIRQEVEEWVVERQAAKPGARLAIHITAGGKTGIGWQNGEGGLRLEDALALRKRYGTGEGKILIVVDAAQGRLTTAEIRDLWREGVLINITPSKFAGGYMFGHAMLVPPELAEESRTWVKKHKLPIGLRDYVTQSDLRGVLNTRMMPELFDLPDVVSVLKWAGPLPVIKEYTRLVESVRTGWQMETLAHELVTNFWSAMHSREMHNMSGIPWNIAEIKRRNVWQKTIHFDALTSFYVEQGGRRMSVPQIKALCQELAYFGDGSRGTHYGQAVEVNQFDQTAVMRFAPNQEMFLRLWHEKEMGGSSKYIRTLTANLANKFGRVMEKRMIAATPLTVEMATNRNTWGAWAETINGIVEARLAQALNPEQRAHVSVQALTQMFQKNHIRGVVVMSGKNTSLLELAVSAHRRAHTGKSQAILPVAFVDHPYVSQTTRSILRATLLMYGDIHLHLFDAGPELVRMLTESGLGDRVTIVSAQKPPHPYEKENPQWYLNPQAVDIEAADSLNEYYKADPTREMLAYFTNLNGKHPTVFLRGNRRGQTGRESLKFMEIAKNNPPYFMVHPFVGFDDTAFAEFNHNHSQEVIVDRGYRDVFKEATATKLCGLDTAFANG